jgi:hypothetical protein
MVRKNTSYGGDVRRRLLRHLGDPALAVDLKQLVHLLAVGADVDLNTVPGGKVGLGHRLGGCDVALPEGGLAVSERIPKQGGRRRCRISLGMFVSLAVAGSLTGAVLGGVRSP